MGGGVQDGRRQGMTGAAARALAMLNADLKM
jgi:hypothetical protein